MLNDTIAAISTPLGRGGIGIVRLSGPDAVEIARKMFKPVNERILLGTESHRLLYGHVVEPRTGDIIDEVLLGVMRAPNTYTREDVVEFNCHGGPVPLRKTLELALRLGARLAEPGEFTRRAFLNGRIDLAQAEAVNDIIRAGTEEGLRLAVSQLRGRLSERVREVQDSLLQLLAQVEAELDFPEEDFSRLSRDELKLRVKEIIAGVSELVKSAQKGKIYREGIKAVIVGKPNVGKSSLLNALLGEKRAIVTEIPGTTRDVIEDLVDLRGIPVRIMDTAGLRQTEDVVEKIGVERARDLLSVADLVLLVLDACTGVEEEDEMIMGMIGQKRGIVLLNKIDVCSGDGLEERIRHFLVDWPVLKISALTGEGLELLEEEVERQVHGGEVAPVDSLIVSNARHKAALEQAVEELEGAVEAVEMGLTDDIIALELRAAWEKIGEITGTTVTEDIVDKIFADFCIGK